MVLHACRSSKAAKKGPRWPQIALGQASWHRVGQAESPPGGPLELLAAPEPSRRAVEHLANVPSTGYDGRCASGTRALLHRASMSNSTDNPRHAIQPVANSQRPALIRPMRNHAVFG